MAQVIKETGSKEKLKGEESTNKEMEGHMMVSGKIIWCMEKESIVGPMVESTSEGIMKTKKMALEFISGLTGEGLKGSGEKGKEMVQEKSSILLGSKNMDFG